MCIIFFFFSFLLQPSIRLRIKKRDGTHKYFNEDALLNARKYTHNTEIDAESR